MNGGGRGAAAGGEGEEPLVTIIIPTFNRAGLVEKAIDSTLAQEYARLEVLVLDDGSTDGTDRILAGYAERHGDRFRWDRHDNRGQALTLNRGFEMARGDVVGYLSSDDLFLPGAIAKMVAVLNEDPETVLVYPAFHVVGEAGEVLNTVVPPEYTTAESLRLHSCIVNVGAIYRRSVTERTGGWDPSFTYVADFDFCVRASLLGRFRRVEEPLACWRAHPDSANAAPGLLGAREQTMLLDKIYARDDLSDDVIAVRDEAYRNAHFVAAYALGGVNTAGQRFFVHDTLARETTVGAPDGDAQMIARLRRRVANLERREEWLVRMVEDLQGRKAQASRFRGRPVGAGGPLWWRFARRAVPARARPHGRRVLETLLGRRVPPPQIVARRQQPAGSKAGAAGSKAGAAEAGPTDAGP